MIHEANPVRNKVDSRTPVLEEVIDGFILNNLKFHDYNICSSKPSKLSKVATLVSHKMNGKGVKCQVEGYSKAYVGDNCRLLQEMKSFEFMNLEDGIDKQIVWQRGDESETF